MFRITQVPNRHKAYRKRRPRINRKPSLLAWQDMVHIVTHARELFAAMPRYDTQRANTIAALLFNQLTSPLREHPVLLSRICGISDATLWQWRIGRTEFNVDLLSKYSDNFAVALGMPPKLAKEVANLMSGVPWLGKKTPAELVHYVTENDLDARVLVHLARRQERMNINAFTKKIGMSKDILERINSPERYYGNPLSIRGNIKMTIVAMRFGLKTPEDIAAFRLLLTRGSAIPRVTQEDIKTAFLKKSAKEQRYIFLQHFFALVRERHGLAGLGSLADAVWEQTFPVKLKAKVSMNMTPFKQRLANNLKPTGEGCTRLPADWSSAVAEFVFPGAREVKLRLALAHYLTND